MRFTDFVHLHRIGADNTFPRLRKDGFKALIRAAGCRTPSTMLLVNNPAEIDEAALPDAFVMKPDNLTSAKGVMLLHRQPDGRYYDLMRRGPISWRKVVEEQQSLREAQLTPFSHEDPAVIVEELVVSELGSGTIPYDYKIFAFPDGCALVMQINRNVRPVEICWFDGQFEPLETAGKIEWNRRAIGLGRHVVPRCAEAMLTDALRIPKALAVAYARVDFYASIDGPTVGEITPGCGGFYNAYTNRLSRSFDHELGARWEAARHGLGLPPLFMPPGEASPATRKRAARRWFHETPWSLKPGVRSPLRLLP